MGNVSTDGAGLPDDKLMHINDLELRIILLALQSFVKKVVNILKSCLIIPQQSIALTKWEHHIQWMSSPSSKNLGMGNCSQKSSYSSSHSRKTKHSG